MKRYFTLTEILVVIGIIGILAAMGVGVFSLVSDRVAYSETETGIKRLEAALQNVKAKFGYLPDYSGMMDVDGNFLRSGKLRQVFIESMGGASNFADMTEEVGSGKYFSDGWGRPYILKVPGVKNRGGFDIVSAGGDGKIGGAAILWDGSDSSKVVDAASGGTFNGGCVSATPDTVDDDDVANF